MLLNNHFTNMQILKADDSLRTATFVALVPDVEDRNGDVITAKEIAKTAHRFMQDVINKKVNVNHKAWTDLEDVKYVESYIAPVDMEIKKGVTIPKWSWLVGMKFNEELFKKVSSGEFSGISIEATWYREEVK